MKLHKNVLLIIFQYVAITLLLSIMSVNFLFQKNEIRWTLNWQNVPEDIREDHAYIRCMSVAENGDLWAGSDNGVIHISGRFVNIYSSKTIRHIRDIEVAPNGDVWILTERNDMLRFDGYTWQQMPTKIALMDIAITKDGKIWGATSNGLSQFTEKKWQQSVTMPSIPNPSVKICSVGSGEDGSLWVSSCSEGSALFHIANENIQESIPLDGVDIVIKIENNTVSRVWFYSIAPKAGITSIGFLENDHLQLYLAKELNSPKIGLDHLNDLSADWNGNAWIATNDGVCLFNGQFCTTYLKGECIYSVAAAPDGSVWLGLENQIVKLSR